MTTTPGQVRDAIGMTAEEEHAVPTDESKNYTHIISPPENHEIFGWLMQHGNNDPSSRDIVDIARMHRWRVRALCGFEFVPQLNPENYDACQICMDVAGMHMRNAGE